MSEQIQTITIVMTDGRRCSYSGPAQMEPGDSFMRLEVGEPQPLPPGCRWGDPNEEAKP